MWGPPSQLDLPYRVRHMRKFKDKYQRPLTDKENEILERIKKADPENFGPKFKVEGNLFPGNLSQGVFFTINNFTPQ